MTLLDTSSRSALFSGGCSGFHFDGCKVEKLRKYELFKHCLRLKTQGFTGTLVLERAEGNTAIRFDGGEPFFASSEDVTLSFAGLLIRRSVLDPSTLKSLLELSIENHVKLEDLLVDQGRMTSKEVVKTKRELSSLVFLNAFGLDDIPIRSIAGEVSDEEASMARAELEVYETLFRAVLGEPDRNVFMRLFRERWDEVLEKTADFYRHMLRFRAVSYGEDIVVHLMEGEPTARKVLGVVQDKEGALAKLFALTYSGMLAFHGAPRAEVLPRPFTGSDDPMPSKVNTDQLSPKTQLAEDAPVTTELHALARAAARRGPKEQFDAAFGRATSGTGPKPSVTEDRLGIEVVRQEIIRQAESLGVSKEVILEALGPQGDGPIDDNQASEAALGPAPGQETLVGLVDALREVGVPLDGPESDLSAAPAPAEPAPQQEPEAAVSPDVDQAANDAHPEEAVSPVMGEAADGPAQASATPIVIGAADGQLAEEEVRSSAQQLLDAMDEESKSELPADQEGEELEELVIPLETGPDPAAMVSKAVSGIEATVGVEPSTTGVAEAEAEEEEPVAAHAPGVSPEQAPAPKDSDGFPKWAGSALFDGSAAASSVGQAPRVEREQPQPYAQVQQAPGTAQPLPAQVQPAPQSLPQQQEEEPSAPPNPEDLARMIDQAMAQAALAVNSPIPATRGAIPMDEPLALEVDHGTTEGREKTGEGIEDQQALSVLLAGLPPLPARSEPSELGTDESIERILEEVYKSLAQRNLYEMLNVTPMAPLSAVRDAANRLRNKYAPSQYRGFLMSKRAHKILKLVREAVDRAEQVLTHIKSRKYYDEMASTTYPLERNAWLHQLFHAERDFQFGLKLLQEKEFARAVDLIGRAVTTNGNDPDYVAWRGYATYQRAKSGIWDDPSAVTRARADLEAALTLEPRHTRALLFMARMEDDQNNLDTALAWYSRLQKADPGNEEAAEALERLRKIASEKRSGDPGGWLKFRGMFNKKK